MDAKLTNKQQVVYNFYSNFIEKNKYAPTYDYAASKLGINKSAVYKHVLKLVQKKVLQKSEDGRTVTIPSQSKQAPLLGSIACGEPIDILEETDINVEIPSNINTDFGAYYALKAKGESMINAGIADGDTLIIRKQDTVQDGDIAVVAIGEDSYEEQATLKRVYFKPQSLMLKPENDNFPATFLKDAKIRGKLVGVIRSYE